MCVTHHTPQMPLTYMHTPVLPACAFAFTVHTKWARAGTAAGPSQSAGHGFPYFSHKTVNDQKRPRSDPVCSPMGGKTFRAPRGCRGLCPALGAGISSSSVLKKSPLPRVTGRKLCRLQRGRAKFLFFPEGPTEVPSSLEVSSKAGILFCSCSARSHSFSSQGSPSWLSLAYLNDQCHSSSVWGRR